MTSFYMTSKGRTAFRRRGPVVLCLLALSTSQAVADVQPEWLLTGHQQRVVFEISHAGDDSLLVSMPKLLTSNTGTNALPLKPESLAAFDSYGRRVPHRIVHQTKEVAWALISTRNVTEGQEFTLYGDAETDAPAAPPLPPVSGPLKIEIHKPLGPSVPGSWDQLLYLYRQSGLPRSVTRRAYYDDLPWVETERGRGQQKYPQGWIARLRTIVLCPQPGIYRFALDCRDCGFVFLDGEMVASWPGEHEPGGWRHGAPVMIDGGPHELDVFCFSGGQLEIKVGWVTPDTEETVEIPAEALLTSSMAQGTRVQRIDQSLDSFFTFELQNAYSFRGKPTVFVPVRLRNHTQSRLEGTMIARWKLDDRQEIEGETPLCVFTDRTIHRVAMEVRDSFGFVGRHERAIDCRFVQHKEYAVSAAVVDLPAVGFADDTVLPRLRLEGSLPYGEKLQVQCRIERTHGKPETVHYDQALGAKPTFLPMVRTSLGELRQLTWSVRHRGEELQGGKIKILCPPFEVLPGAVVGDAIYDRVGGTRLVLVPYRGAGRFDQPVIETEQAFGHLLCVDDFVSPPGLHMVSDLKTYDRVLARIVDGPDQPWVTHVALSSRRDAESAYGPLIRLVEIPAAVKPETDVVILSVGLQDILTRQKPEVFERYVAALSDIVAVSLRRPVIWVTPPPYLDEEDRVRPFAVAVQRVADARRIPVADVFTAFRGMRDMQRLLRDEGLALSQSGQSMVAQLVARAMLRP